MKKRPWALLPIIALSGAVAMAQAPSTAPPSQSPSVGLIGLGLNVADIDASTKFYVEGLGMTPLSRITAGNMFEQFLGYPATPYPTRPVPGAAKPPILELLSPKTPAAPAAPPAAPPPSRFKIVLSVDNADAINARLKAAGYAPPPVRFNQQAGGGSFVIKDPDGYTVEIVQQGPTTAAPAAK